MNKIIVHITDRTNLSTQQAWWLLEFITNKTRIELQYLRIELSSDQQNKLHVCIEQINNHQKPLAYILGWVPFLNLKLSIQSPTLIPRPETEAWVDKVITMMQSTNKNDFTILDIGTGSGCIGLSLAKAFPESLIYAVDVSLSALELAQKNAALNQITNIKFLQSDLFKNLPHNLKFDLIVSNPPYIDPIIQLDTSIMKWEDHNALFADNQGLNIIEQIIQQAPGHLKKDSLLNYQLIIEIDASQGDIVKKLAQNAHFTCSIIQKDQFDRNRTLWTK